MCYYCELIKGERLKPILLDHSLFKLYDNSSLLIVWGEHKPELTLREEVTMRCRLGDYFQCGFNHIRLISEGGEHYHALIDFYGP